MNLDLLKAVFEAGFRAGYNSGNDHAVAFDWGSTSREPSSGSKAWAEYVEPYLAMDGSSRLEPDSPQSWENVP